MFCNYRPKLIKDSPVRRYNIITEFTYFAYVGVHINVCVSSVCNFEL